MFAFPRDCVSQTTARLLCVVLTLHLQVLTSGCGTQQNLDNLSGGVVRIPLTAGHPIKDALRETGFNDAETIEINLQTSRFRILFPDTTKVITGEFVLAAGAWEMTHFQFSSGDRVGEMFLDPNSRQVTLIQTSEGDVWEPAKDATASARVVGGDRLESYLASNAELLSLSTEGASKPNASFAFVPAFFIYIMTIWLLCADMHPIVGFFCPGFGPIFVVIVAILGAIPTPASANQPPDARDDALAILSNSTLNASVLPDNGSGPDSEPDGDPLSTSLVTPTTNGTVALQADGGFTYTPNTNFRGTDSFVYQLSDGRGGTDNATATITIANRPPDAKDDAFSFFSNETTHPGNLFSSNAFGADSDPESDALTVIAVNGLASNVGTLRTLASGGELTVLANGNFSYKDAGTSGPVDAFTYTISDGRGGTDTATVSIVNLPTP